MSTNQELIGKTITGVVAVTEPGETVREIWMMQFSDGTHVEFVSPTAKRALRRSVCHRKGGLNRQADAMQLVLNVA